MAAKETTEREELYQESDRLDKRIKIGDQELPYYSANMIKKVQQKTTLDKSDPATIIYLLDAHNNKKARNDVDYEAEAADIISGTNAGVLRNRLAPHPDFIFALVEQANARTLQTLLRPEYGLNVNATNSLGFSVIAHAIMHTQISTLDVCPVLEVVLEHFVDPLSIPSDMWKDDHVSKLSVADTDLSPPWTCSARKVVAQQLNISLRYRPRRASQVLFRPDAHRRALAEATGAHNILNLHSKTVGQEIATYLVTIGISSALAQASDRSTVLCFAGLCGGGKTKLARSLETVLNLPFVEIHLGQVSHPWELFGPPQDIEGHHSGARLSNFLLEHRGHPAVVFLDHFDLTNRSCLLALVNAMKGSFTNNLSGDVVDTKSIIWVLALTSLTCKEEVASFYEKHGSSGQHHTDEYYAKAMVGPLQRQIRQAIYRDMGHEIGDQITTIVPFLPFTEEEQMVIFRDEVRKFANRIRKPIDLRPGPMMRMVGDCLLEFQEEEVCRHLARTYYTMECGAWSVTRQAMTAFESRFVMAYSAREEDLKEGVEPRIFRLMVATGHNGRDWLTIREKLPA